MTNKYLEKIAASNEVAPFNMQEYIPKGFHVEMNPGDIPKGFHVEMNPGDIAKKKFWTQGKSTALKAGVALGAASGLAYVGQRTSSEAATKKRYAYPSAYGITRKQIMTEETPVAKGVAAGVLAGAGAAVGHNIGSLIAHDRAYRELSRKAATNPRVVVRANVGKLNEGLLQRAKTGGKYGAIAGGAIGLSLAAGGIKGVSNARDSIKERIAKKEMAKKASAIQKTKGLGSYLLHNAVVPGAVIFGADLGAHAAAEKLVKKPETPKA